MVKVMMRIENIVGFEIHFRAFGDNRRGFRRVNDSGDAGVAVNQNVGQVVHVADAAGDGADIKHYR